MMRNFIRNELWVGNDRNRGLKPVCYDLCAWHMMIALKVDQTADRLRMLIMF